LTNREIAEQFERVADLLRARRAHPRQIGAWRSAAAVLRNHRVELSVAVDRDGWGVLERLPRLGAGLRLAVRELMQTGQLGTLEDLRITTNAGREEPR
jgi:DNA polymerase/3'-5' exonuclease PolX